MKKGKRKKGRKKEITYPTTTAEKYLIKDFGLKKE